MIDAIIIFSLIALLCGILLAAAAVKFHVSGDPMIDKIDAVLPQTQCGQCGYPGCKPYAQAIAEGKADINLCPPGGQRGVVALSELLGVESKPLHEGIDISISCLPSVALIDEETCIGCTKCIQVCPVDAIVGAAKQKHTVLLEYCTGCKLCLAPVCPVENCIKMIEKEQSIDDWDWPAPIHAKELMHGVSS